MAGNQDALRDLPTPISGTRIDGDAPQHATQDAARLLYFARLIANTAGVPVFQLQQALPDGSGHITAQVAGPLARKKIHGNAPQPQEARQQEAEKTEVVRLVWLPEGFVITPRSKQHPQGLGLPPADGQYTGGGPLPQVIINQYPHNQYPDAIYRQETGVQQIPDATRVCAANLFFMDWELLDDGFGIGLHLPDSKDSKKTIWRAQFKKRFETNFSEPGDESGQWYCHRPQFAHESGVLRYLRQQTNNIRALAGQKPLDAPLRGMAGELSESPAYMTQYGGVFGHDSYQFPSGHISFEMRVARAATDRFKGENIHLQPGSNADVTTANIAVQGWRTSPGHYANMIRDWHQGDDKKYYASMCCAVRPLAPDAAAHTIQNPPYGLGATYSPINPPVKPAMVSSQIFDGRKEWVFHNGIARSVNNPEMHPLIECRLLRHSYFHFSGFFILNETTDSFVAHANDRKPPEAKNDWQPSFAYRGRRLFLGDALRDINRFEILGTREVTRNGEIAALRVACREQSADDESVHIILYEGGITDFAATCTEIGRLDISGNDSHVFSTPVFSASGEKMALMLARLDTTHANTGTTASNITINGFVGQMLHFFEFADGAFTQVDSAQIWIAPRHENRTDKPYSFEVSHGLKAGCRYLPVYVQESLDFVTLHIDSHFYYKTTAIEKNGVTHEEIKNDFRLFCELQFPGGARIVCYDLSAPDHESDITGFYRVILVLDVEHPQSALLARYDMPQSTGGMPQWSQFIAVALECGGKVFKTSPRPLARRMVEYPRTKINLSPADMNNDANEAYRQASIARGGNRFFEYLAPVPVTVMLAGLSSQHEIINTSAGPRKLQNPYFLISRNYRRTNAVPGSFIEKHWLYRYESFFLGPLVAEQNYHYSLYSYATWDPASGTRIYHYPFKHLNNSFHYARYGNAWIHAGRIDQAFGPIGDRTRIPHLPDPPFYGDIQDAGWLGDAQYYFFSNLDLKEITGMPDLSDNILPIGAI